MEWLAYIMWVDDSGVHEEYHPFPELEEAQHYSDYKAGKLKEQCESGKIRGFDVLIYEATNY